VFEAGEDVVVPAACEVALFFALAGAPILTVEADHQELRAGDAAIVRPRADVNTSIAVGGVDVLLYAAVVSRVPTGEHA
jgi:hypothetical protein